MKRGAALSRCDDEGKLNTSFRIRSFSWNPAAPDWHSGHGPLWYRSGPGHVAARRKRVEIEVDQVVTCERTFVMRYLLLTSAALGLGAATAALASEPTRTVYLDSVVLDQIKKSNPDRYARIRTVMTKASEMCKPNAARTWALADGPADCSSLILKTSYPPKRQISFAIDDTTYTALVTVLDAPALVKAEPGKVVPLDTQQLK